MRPGYYYGPGLLRLGLQSLGRSHRLRLGMGVGNPWFGFYGGYFQPYPVYPSAAFWLTDYIISQDLQAAYAARQEAQPKLRPRELRRRRTAGADS